MPGLCLHASTQNADFFKTKTSPHEYDEADGNLAPH